MIELLELLLYDIHVIPSMINNQRIFMMFFGMVVVFVCTISFSFAENDMAINDIQSPKQQLDSGVLPNNIQCKQDLVLVNRGNDKIACVKESTAQKLGWNIITTKLDTSKTLVVDLPKTHYDDLNKDQQAPLTIEPLVHRVSGDISLSKAPKLGETTKLEIVIHSLYEFISFEDFRPPINIPYAFEIIDDDPQIEIKYGEYYKTISKPGPISLDSPYNQTITIKAVKPGKWHIDSPDLGDGQGTGIVVKEDHAYITNETVTNIRHGFEWYNHLSITQKLSESQINQIYGDTIVPSNFTDTTRWHTKFSVSQPLQLCNITNVTLTVTPFSWPPSPRISEISAKIQLDPFLMPISPITVEPLQINLDDFVNSHSYTITTKAQVTQPGNYGLGGTVSHGILDVIPIDIPNSNNWTKSYPNACPPVYSEDILSISKAPKLGETAELRLVVHALHESLSDEDIWVGQIEIPKGFDIVVVDDDDDPQIEIIDHGKYRTIKKLGPISFGSPYNQTITIKAVESGGWSIVGGSNPWHHMGDSADSLNLMISEDHAYLTDEQFNWWYNKDDKK